MTTLNKEYEYDDFDQRIASLKTRLQMLEDFLDEWEKRDARPLWRRVLGL